MASRVHPRLENLLASFTLNLADEQVEALERAAGLTGSATQALLALDEFLGGANVGKLADVFGLSHSGAVRLVSQLEVAGLVVRRTGSDRRRVEVHLTARGRRRASAARDARDAVICHSTEGLDEGEVEALEGLLAKLVRSRVVDRLERRRAGDSGPWWCRTCDFAACGRPEGRCPAHVTADAVEDR